MNTNFFYPLSKSSMLKQALLIFISVLCSLSIIAQVGISNTLITPLSSSILELRSSTQGFLSPRMTTTERDAISSPATGLQIYNTTTNLLNFYNGSIWQITGGGSVSSVSITTANGVSGTVTNASTVPAISLTLGAITPTTVIATGSVTGSNLSGTNTGDQINITGNAATVTTNANLTGEVTSVGNTTTIAANTITNVKLANMITKTYRGRTAAGTGVPEDVPVATLKSDLVLIKADVGLANVDNTSDANKPISTAQQNALNLKADLVSPAFTGVPTGPTAAIGTNTTQLATTSFVIANKDTRINITADVINSTVTLADVTGLSFPIVSGGTYYFKFVIPYNSAAAGTGSQWTLNGPATTALNYITTYTSSATASVVSYSSVYNGGSATASSPTVGCIAIIEGVATFSAAGNLVARFASEVGASAITVKAGATVLFDRSN